MPFRETQRPEIISDGFGTSEATRFYTVWNASPSAVVSSPANVLRGENSDGLPTNEPLPDYRSQFPGVAGLELIAYQVQGNGIVLDVQARYATGGITIFPPPDLSTAWTGSFQTEEFTIPFALLKASKVPGIPSPNAPPGTPIPQVEVLDWAFDEQPIYQTVVRHSRKARVVVDLAAAIDIIAEQNNKLHKIGNRWYRFEAGDYQPYDATRYEFTYSFVFDSGTQAITTSEGGPPATDPGGGPSLVRSYMMPPSDKPHPVAQVYPNFLFTRPPFCNVFVFRGRGSPSGPQQGSAEPVFVAFCNYDISYGIGGEPGLGWLRLPGILQ